METKIKRTPEQKEARRLDIAAQQKQAKDWVLARHLRRHPVLVAQEITVVETSTDTNSNRTFSHSRAGPSKINNHQGATQN